jgi:hypothetical protein
MQAGVRSCYRLSTISMSKQLSATKAKRILKDGSVRGKPLTRRQKRMFGAVAAGQKPRKK